MSFRYKYKDVKGDIIINFVPQDEGPNQYIDINGMSSESNNEIFSCELKIGHCNLVA